MNNKIFYNLYEACWESRESKIVYEIYLLYRYKTEMYDRYIGCPWNEERDEYYIINQTQRTLSNAYASKINKLMRDYIRFNEIDIKYLRQAKKQIQRIKFNFVIEQVKDLKLEEKYDMFDRPFKEEEQKNNDEQRKRAFIKNVE